jgi:Histidine kinase-, DNA gyrase B-, and HSP90-like ATPase
MLPGLDPPTREALAQLAEEQAALRRVAVLVAQQPSPSEVFTAVTQAVGLLLDADLAVMHVYPGDGTATTIASWSGDGPILPIGTRFPLDGDNLAAQVEVGAYYVVSEALTNAAKHSSASKMDVHARARDGVLALRIDDDGVGGADPARGSGLTGLADRVEALGGEIWIASPPGEGTSLRVELPLDSESTTTPIAGGA